MSLKLWVVLARAHRAVAECAKRDVAGRGLTPTEFAVLEALYHKGDLPVGELGDRVLLSSGSMTYVVDKLAGRELLRRRPGTDQRVREVALTAAGRRLMDRIFPEHAEAIRAALSGLTAAEQRRATDLLKRLGKQAAARASPRAAPARTARNGRRRAR